MPRILIALLLATLGWAAQAAPASSDRLLPIRSEAALQRYLREVPTAATPLASLPPASRKRFLAQLEFRPGGVDINYGEPAAELTSPQIAALYALFGQPAPTGIGLTAGQQRQRQRERAADARRRGCVPARCPESAIEQRFATFSARKPDFAMPDAQRFAAEKRDYDHLFGGFFDPPDALQAAGDADLRLLARALHSTLYAVPDTRHVRQLEQVLRAMQRRRMTDDDDFKPLYAALVALRRFSDADALRREHPGMQAPGLPAFVATPTPRAGIPTVLDVDASALSMRRQAIDLDDGMRIVVIAGCHFSEDAARAIAGDSQLHALFVEHAIWLAAPTESFDDVAAWNRQFPAMPMRIAWNHDEWSMLPSWAMPTYYVYRNGKPTGRFAGWLGVDRLRQSLHEAGAL